ncbi:hypothetical protein [Planktotalea sp.]|uniref:hypothetical protein n=1 Tax=Planktotalea sp. TaxID=2029877 RepID=UPI00329A6B78
MIRALALFALVVIGSAANAQSVKLTAEQIRDVLTGNTAIGKWEGVKYRQFFGPDGITLYAQDGARTARGKWRIDTAKDEYQSIWPNDADWEGWFVMEYAGAYYWVSKSTPPTPFRVQEGQHLVAQ